MLVSPSGCRRDGRLPPGPHSGCVHNAPSSTHREGECFDVNEADPSALLENVYESGLLHAAESGGVAPGGSGTRR